MIDLHLHLDGSLRPGTVRELLSEEGLEPWDSDKQAECDLRVSDSCTGLNEYLTKFDYPCRALQRPAGITRAVYELGEDLAEQDITYAEIRFAPMLLTAGGMTQAEAVQAAIDGAVMAERKPGGIKLGLILCCMRGQDHDSNMVTVETAARFMGQHVCALDLAGAEALYPTELYYDEFSYAKSKGIPFTIHAGEAAGSESIWKALELGASRIGHGVRCIEDGALVDYLARHKIPLEVCPTSNMQTKVFADMEEYPLKEPLLQGVHVTLNTDNMTVSNTSLMRERKFVMKYCGITKEDIALMEQYSREAAFLL